MSASLYHTGPDGDTSRSEPSSAEKRKFTEKASPELPRKKMSFGLQKPNASAPKIQMNLGSGNKAAPIKMSLGGGSHVSTNSAVLFLIQFL